MSDQCRPHHMKEGWLRSTPASRRHRSHRRPINHCTEHGRMQTEEQREQEGGLRHHPASGAGSTRNPSRSLELVRTTELPGGAAAPPHAMRSKAMCY